MRSPSNDICAISAGAVAGERWFVTQTQRRAEGWEIAHFERQGFAPLLPDYLFHYLDTAHNLWRAVNGTRGVARLISKRETAAPLPNGIVEGLPPRSMPVTRWIGHPTSKLAKRFVLLTGRLRASLASSNFSIRQDAFACWSIFSDDRFCSLAVRGSDGGGVTQ
jgi:hypothetical protein